MASDNISPEGTKFPLTLKDIISMVTVAVTLTLAWGVFGTRLTVLEREAINIHATLKDQKDMIKENQLRIRENESRIRDLEGSVEDLWQAGKKRR